jgi:hypothetical protein
MDRTIVILSRVCFKIQPRATLDGLLTGDQAGVSFGRRVIEQASQMAPSPFDEIDEAVLFDWCGQDPATRFPLAASLVPPLSNVKDHEPAPWSAAALRLVHAAPDPIAVMRELIIRHLRPMMPGSSRAVEMETMAKILDRFDTQGNASLAAFIAATKERLMDEVRKELAWETKFDKEADERFE